jgi:hypothetical protein
MMLATLSPEFWITLAVGVSGNVLTLLTVWVIWAKEKRKRLLMEPVTQQEFQEYKKESALKIETIRDAIRDERAKDTENLREDISKVSDRVVKLEGQFGVGFDMITKALSRIETRLMS